MSEITLQQSGLRYQKALTRFLDHLEPQSTILEINSERLAYSKVFFESGYNLIDIETVSTDIQHPNNYAKETIHQPLESVLLPYRSVQGIWAHQSFSYYPRKNLFYIFDRCLDWLSPDGVMSFCMPEGEGEVVQQSMTGYGNQQLLRVYYQAEELNKIIQSSGFEVVDAWREQHNEVNFLHVLCKNPR